MWWAEPKEEISEASEHRKTDEEKAPESMDLHLHRDASRFGYICSRGRTHLEHICLVMRAHCGACHTDHESRERVKTPCIAGRRRNLLITLDDGLCRRRKPFSDGARLERQSEHSSKPEHGCNGDMLDLLGGEWAARCCAKPLHPYIRGAV